MLFQEILVTVYTRIWCNNWCYFRRSWWQCIRGHYVIIGLIYVPLQEILIKVYMRIWCNNWCYFYSAQEILVTVYTRPFRTRWSLTGHPVNTILLQRRKCGTKREDYSTISTGLIMLNCPSFLVINDSCLIKITPNKSNIMYVYVIV